jgi:NAD(P)-dependent dehydrogenase (short-subunit alcohol dehydrogenase family)
MFGHPAEGNGRLCSAFQQFIANVLGPIYSVALTVALRFLRTIGIAIVYTKEEERDAAVTKQGIEAEGRKCLLIAGDVSRQKFCEKAVERTVKELGSLDVLVNNAAFQVHTFHLEDLTDGDRERTGVVSI